MQTITPVPGAIGHQQRVKAAAITNSDSLIPFIPSRAPSSSSHPSSPHRLYVPSTLSLIFPFRSLRFSPSLARSLVLRRRRSPAPFTFAHYSRKSNFVTRAGSIRARIPSSIPGKLHVGRHRRLERRFPLSSAFLPPPPRNCPPPHTGCPLTPSNQLPPRTMTRPRGKRETPDTFGGIVNSTSHVAGIVNECDESVRDEREK